jgi:flagellar hook-associated protein 1
MPGLNTSLNISVQALMAEQGALNITTNNIANVNTPGYTREVPILSEAATIQQGNVRFGGGVVMNQFQSVRDQLLQLRMYEETQQQNNSGTQLNSLTQIESLFSDPTKGVGGAMTDFFNSLSQLSTNPTDNSARQQVLSTANNLAIAFHQSVSGLGTIQSDLDQSVPQAINQINQLTSQIATLNGQVAQIQGLGQDPGTVQDQRDQLITQLSALVNVSVTTSEHGLTLTTANGVPLVVANKSFDLQTSNTASGFSNVVAQGQDITSQITGGKLAGIINVRDQVIPDLLNRLDTLANQFSTSFNTQNQAGFTLSGSAGGNFFTPPTAVTGSAANFGVAITDPSLIAASSDGSAGSNGNVAQLIGIRDTNLPAGNKPLDMFANLVLQVGTLGSNAKADSDASTAALQQVSDQIGAVSGVSLDEETTNMIRYQRAYQAAARVVSTVNTMYDSLLSMGLGG